MAKFPRHSHSENLRPSNGKRFHLSFALVSRRTIDKRWPRPVFVACVALTVAVSAGRVPAIAAPTVAAAKAAKTPTVSTTKAPATRTAASDLNGWETINPSEWPQPTDAVRVTAIHPAIRVYRRPNLGSGAIRLDEKKSAYGQIVFLGLGRTGDFIRVLMPLRPNGSVGFVYAPDVRLDRVSYRVVVEVDRKLLTVETPNGVLLTATVATGTNNTPTPTGLFYVREIVPQANPKGPFGPIALGLSGLSTALRSFSGGYGRIALHGTNAPGTLGGDASFGCVRLDNATVVKLSRLLPLGTPVEIVETKSVLNRYTSRITSTWMERPDAPIEDAIDEVVEDYAQMTTTTVAPFPEEPPTDTEAPFAP